MNLQAEEWKIDRRGRGCAVCERKFESEEEHYSGIVEGEKGFQRRDICAACWDRKPELFSFWKTRSPRREERRLENLAAMIDFFKRLIEKPSDDPLRAKITYLTALLLIRKRKLKLSGSPPGSLRLERSWDGESFELPAPAIEDSELEHLRQQMEQLFEIEIGAAELER